MKKQKSKQKIQSKKRAISFKHAVKHNHKSYKQPHKNANIIKLLTIIIILVILFILSTVIIINRPVDDNVLGVKTQQSRSHIDTTPPTLKAALSGSNVTLKWNKKPNAVKYEIFRSLSPDGLYAVIGQVEGAKSSYSDKGLGLGRQYYYKITASFKKLENTAISNPSNIVTVRLNSKYIDRSKFTFYNQFDKKWNKVKYAGDTIAKSGCGPTAMAMIIATFKQSKTSPTPNDIAKYSSDNGVAWGTRYSFSGLITSNPDYGIKQRRISELENWMNNKTATNMNKIISTVNDVFINGGVILTSGIDTTNSGLSPYPDVGHYIVVRGVTKNNKWIVADPNGQKGISNSKKEFAPSEIISKRQSDNNFMIAVYNTVSMNKVNQGASSSSSAR